MIPQLANCKLTCPTPDDKKVPLFLADMNDCSRFFICYNGNAIHRSCAEGLLFDAQNNWCNFAYLVDCGWRSGGHQPTTTTPIWEESTEEETPSPPLVTSDPDYATPPTVRTTTFNPDVFYVSLF